MGHNIHPNVTNFLEEQHIYKIEQVFTENQRLQHADIATVTGNNPTNNVQKITGEDKHCGALLTYCFNAIDKEGREVGVQSIREEASKKKTILIQTNLVKN